MPLKTRQVNIGTEVQPKFEKIGDYWDDAMVDKVTNFLHNTKICSLQSFSDLKGIICNLGVMKITLKPDVKPVK